ncbi:MAG TPA: ankyrin repeat domain-containing protein [Pyrinomonadaceae bacterium]
MPTLRFTRLLAGGLLLLTLCCARLAAQDTYVTYMVTGRVVDEKGKPVAGALVGLRVPDPQSPDAYYSSISGKDGRFASSETAAHPVDKATFYVSAPPSDSFVPVDLMFGRLSYLDSSFGGRTVNFNGKERVDLGDVRVQAHYHKVRIRLLDANGSPLASDASFWRHVLLRVRDARGDVVLEGGVIEPAMRKDESAIVIALPAGTWELAVTAFGDSYSWSPLDAPVTLAEGAKEPVSASVRLADTDCKTNDAAQGARLTPEEARRELEKRNISYTEEEFIERARRGNASAVRLFLAAGMNVDARDREGRTALMVSSGPGAGHADIICTLLGAGAAVNARDFGGKTALVTASGIVNAHVMKMLLDGGADVNVQTDDGFTPLMLAAQAGQANTVRVLLDAGANPLFKNGEGKTALVVAFREEGNQVVSILEKAAAEKSRAKQ